MSIQLKILLLILLSTITLFILLEYFQPNLGPNKLRRKDIKYRETTDKQKSYINNFKQNHHADNNNLNEIVNVTETDNETYGIPEQTSGYTSGDAKTASQTQTPPHIQNNINLDQNTKTDNKQTLKQRTQYSTSFKQESPEPIYKFPISKQ